MSGAVSTDGTLGPEATTPSAEGARRVDASPFDLRPAAEATGAAALCIHGLTGTPYEVRPLGEALAEAGVRAVGLLLPGHNSTPEMLARTTHEDWQTAVRMAYQRIAAEHDRVFVVGLSLGGLLALDLAATEPVSGLVAIGTPLRLAPPIPLVVPILKHFVGALEKKNGSDIRDEAARARHPGYREMPLGSVHELIRLQARVRSVLGRVTAPALIAHGAHDRTARPADARWIGSSVGSKEVEVVVLNDSAHVVPVDHDGPQLARRVAAFVRERV